MCWREEIFQLLEKSLSNSNFKDPALMKWATDNLKYSTKIKLFSSWHLNHPVFTLQLRERKGWVWLQHFPQVKVFLYLTFSIPPPQFHSSLYHPSTLTSSSGRWKSVLVIRFIVFWVIWWGVVKLVETIRGVKSLRRN